MARYSLATDRGSKPLTVGVLLVGHELCFCHWFCNYFRKSKLCPSAFIIFAPPIGRKCLFCHIIAMPKIWINCISKLGRKWRDKSISVYACFGSAFPSSPGRLGCRAWEHGAETLHTMLPGAQGGCNVLEEQCELYSASLGWVDVTHWESHSFQSWPENKA